MKTKKRKMKISYLDNYGDECSIIQEMSKQTIGTWIWWLIDDGNKVVGVKEIKKNEE